MWSFLPGNFMCSICLGGRDTATHQWNCDKEK